VPEIKKAYATIMVDDLDKAVDFYTQVLGMVEDLRFGDNWAEMVVQGLTIGLHPKKVGTSPELAAKMGWGAVAQSHDGASAGFGTPTGPSHPLSDSAAKGDIIHRGLPSDVRAGGQAAQPHGAPAGQGPSSHSGASAAHPHGGTSTAHNLTIGFEVKDIRATAKEMEAKGVKFHFQENEVNILAFFFDPDGTPLYLTQVR